MIGMRSMFSAWRVLMLQGILAALAPHVLSAGEQPRTLSPAVSTVVDLVNQFRQAEKLSPLRANQKLTTTAQDFADFMARTDQYGHEADGKQPADRVKEHGYQYCVIAENIAYQQNPAEPTPQDLAQVFVKVWQESPEHRKNMLDKDMAETGVGIAKSEASGKHYAVQLFGRPKSMEIRIEIVNRTEHTIQYSFAGRSSELGPQYTGMLGLCRPEAVELSWADARGAKQTRSVQPTAGTRYVLQTDASGVSITTEAIEPKSVGE